MSAETRSALDQAIRDHAADEIVVDGEVIVTWLVLAGTRNHVDGGAVLTIPTDGSMPRWQAKGLLVEALDMARESDDEDES